MAERSGTPSCSLALSLGLKLAALLGALRDGDAAWRGLMVALGAIFVFMGNALPKTLTPLAELRCDAARVQAFQRFAGWTWVLTGLSFAAVWLALPLAEARPTSVALLIMGMFAVASQLVRLRKGRRVEP